MGSNFNFRIRLEGKYSNLESSFSSNHDGYQIDTNKLNFDWKPKHQSLFDVRYVKIKTDKDILQSEDTEEMSEVSYRSVSIALKHVRINT